MKIRSVICLTLLFCSMQSIAQETRTQLNNVNAGKLWAALWQQRAAEYKALCFQAYNIAKLRVDLAVKQKHLKPLAIVTDLDETVLDNSPEDARAAINNQDYNTKAWKAWTAKGVADTVPGAPSFFKYAAKKGITVFYITNRETDEREGTLANLKMYGMPFADNTHLILKSGASSKEARRREVLKKYQIVLLCGDNLPDFDAQYDNHPAEQQRTTITQQLRKQFGDKYIIIPNPSYGDFENSLFKYNYTLTPAQKDSIIRSEVKFGY